MWQSWLNGFLGLWLVLLPFLGLPQPTNRIVLIVSGIAVAIFGFWSATASKGKNTNKDSLSGVLPPSGGQNF